MDSSTRDWVHFAQFTPLRIGTGKTILLQSGLLVSAYSTEGYQAVQLSSEKKQQSTEVFVHLLLSTRFGPA